MTPTTALNTATPSTSAPIPAEAIPRRRLFDDVTEQLRALILNRELAPGTRLRQEELAERLGISRTPLREAFRILERDGLIRVSNGNKTVEVVELSLADALALYQVREVLDGLAARLAAQRGLDRWTRARLERDLDDMAAATTPISISKYGVAHADFHIGILEASQNSTLIRNSTLVQSSWQMVLSRRMQSDRDELDGAIDGALVAGISEHRALLTAIIEGKATEAERLARTHIRHTMKALSRAL